MTELDNGAWVAYPRAGEVDGSGGDAFEVRYFGNGDTARLEALGYANDHPEYRAVYMAPGESILEAEEHRD